MFQVLSLAKVSIASVFVAGLIGCGNGLPAEVSAVDEPTTDSDALRGAATRKFRLSFRNVTASNGLSPVLAIVHHDSFDLVTTGEPASPGVAEVAEVGRTDTLVAEVQAVDRTAVIAKAASGTPAGKTGSIDFEVPVSALAYGAKLDFISMIGRSNDTFIAPPNAIDISGLRAGAKLVFAATNFDAGSEENTGNVGDFGAGGHPVAAAEGIVSYDRGLNLRGDAPEIVAWGTVAAVITVERIK